MKLGLPLTLPRDVIRKGSKSFSLATLFLPASAKEKVYILYAWLRYCDDRIDSPNSQLTDLEQLKRQFSQNQADHPFAQLQRIIVENNLSHDYFNEFFEGLRMDLENKGYENLLDLELYCYRVAGVVGLILCPIIGANHPQASKHASALGMGMQLTNICRDIVEDASNHRIYLPRTILNQNLSTYDIVRAPELCQSAVMQLLARAEILYKNGNQGLKYLPFRVAIAVGSASFIYRAIGQKILKNMPETLKKRVVVGKLEKIKCVLQGFYLAVISRFQRLEPR
ncbi:MAG: phytoene/squalene synthase family protein [Bdellovibrio sp.]|nr:phytoene/squalene synthase family protein [Bdellovibrio sp.]